MANKNPSPTTRFQKGGKQPENSGRPKGTRDRISQAFLTALSESFEKDGVAALDKVRTDDPSTYIRVVASLLPKEVELKRPLDGIEDNKLSELIEFVRGQMQVVAEMSGAKAEEVPQVLQ